MGLQISRAGNDVTAVLPLEAGSNKLHCLVVAERELKRFGFVDRRFAASIDSSWPRKKGKMESVTFLLKQLQRKRQGAAPANSDLQCICAICAMNCFMQDTPKLLHLSLQFCFCCQSVLCFAAELTPEERCQRNSEPQMVVCKCG